MKRSTKKNIEKLAAEAVNQMDLDTVCEMVKDLLESNYESLSGKEFNEEWEQVFG